ncbi:TonB-dependent receptor [Orbaceae bacterium ESL0727]|nr:TonB-dependent receptor [Orbaceae bacterium ESL0727]
MKKTHSLFVILSLLPCHVAFANSENSTHQTGKSEKKDDVIVISANRTETSLWDSPVTMQVIDSEQLAKFSGDSITEALRDIPGVTVTDSGMPGRKQIRIRGEIPDRVLILIDGQEFSYQRLYGAGLLIDSESVERIEVVKGPHSVLYGARAIGGVVNFITRKGGKKAIQGDIKTGYDTSARGNFESGSLYGSSNGFDYRISGSNYNYGDRHTPDGTLKDTDFANHSVSSWLGYQFDQHKFGLSLERLQLNTQTYTSADMLAPPLIKFNVNIPNMIYKKVGTFYDYNADGTFWKNLHLDYYDQQIERHFRNNILLQPIPILQIKQNYAVDDRQSTKGGNIQSDFELFQGNKLIIGTQYIRDHVDQHSLTKKGTSINGRPRPETTLKSYDAWKQESWSAFAQDEWRLAKNWTWAVGARQYWLKSKSLNNNADQGKTESSDQHMVGSTSLRYSGFENTELRLSYAQGYVYPTLFKQFAQSSAGNEGITYGNPKLKAEQSDNIEFGVRYKNANWLLDSAIYYAKARDYITTRKCGVDNAQICHGNLDPSQYYDNANKAKTYGLEFQVEYNAWQIVPYISGNLMRREIDLETRKTTKTGDPRFTSKIGLKNSHFFEKWELESDLYARVASKADNHTSTNNLNDSHNAGWTTANLELNAYLGAERQYRAGLQLNNLLDQRYITANESIPSPGFSAIFSIGMNF